MSKSSGGSGTGIAVFGLLVGAAALAYVGFLFWREKQSAAGGSQPEVQVDVSVPDLPQGLVDVDASFSIGDLGPEFGSAIGSFLSLFNKGRTVQGLDLIRQPTFFDWPDDWNQHTLDGSFAGG